MFDMTWHVAFRWNEWFPIQFIEFVSPINKYTQDKTKQNTSSDKRRIVVIDRRWISTVGIERWHWVVCCRTHVAVCWIVHHRWWITGIATVEWMRRELIRIRRRQSHRIESRWTDERIAVLLFEIFHAMIEIGWRGGISDRSVCVRVEWRGMRVNSEQRRVTSVWTWSVFIVFTKFIQRQRGMETFQGLGRIPSRERKDELFFIGEDDMSYFFPGLISRKPLANGLLLIFSLVIWKSTRNDRMNFLQRFIWTHLIVLIGRDGNECRFLKDECTQRTASDRVAVRRLHDV